MIGRVERMERWQSRGKGLVKGGLGWFGVVVWYVMVLLGSVRCLSSFSRGLGEFDGRGFPMTVVGDTR